VNRHRLLFLPGAGDPQHPQGSGHLASYLARELSPEVEVRAPAMPDPEDPHYQSWRDEIERQLADLEEPALVVGHSLGGSVLLKYLAEGNHADSIAALFLVSTPFWGSDLPSFALPDDFAAQLPDLPIFLYHSRDDPEIPVSHLRRYQEHLPHATTRLIDGSEHSFTDGLPQLVRDIQAIGSVGR
jgi:predicted alpha/beta hydrolase family esterase